MCADFSIHDKGDGNPHAHIMLALRPLNERGEWGAKCRKEYGLDGEKITPKAWQAEVERLSAYNGTLYQQMKAMRADIQSVEKIRKSADELAGRRSFEIG